MPNKNYLRGVRFEREVQEIFKKAGYVTMRTAGSHSPYDVILVKKTENMEKIANVCFVQCKTHVIKKKDATS